MTNVIQQNPVSEYDICKIQNREKLAAEYEQESNTRTNKKRQDFINVWENIAAIKTYDAEMDQEYDNYEINRAMLELFRGIDASWESAVMPKTIAYKMELKFYATNPKKSRTQNITPAQMRRISRSDNQLTNHDLAGIVHSWNNQHKL